MNDQLLEYYTRPDFPGSFAGLDAFHRSLTEKTN